MLHLCANCGQILIEDEDGLRHRNAYKKCKQPRIKDLIGVHFMDGYHEIVVKKRHLDSGFYVCDGVRPSRVKGQKYAQEFIVENAFIK